MKAAGRSDPGKIRNKNEDNYSIRQKPYPILAVADGMGGHAAGDVASSIVIDMVEKYEFPENNIDNNVMKDIVNLANKEVIKKGENNPEYQGMGTTLSVGAIVDQKLYYGHVGDSRIYLHRNESLQKISADDSLVAQMLESGEISKQEAFQHPRSNVLTQAIGLEENLDIETGNLELNSDDLLLFCTDGLTDMIPENKIETIISGLNKKQVEKVCEHLLENALAAGGSDNITIVAGWID